MADSSLPSGHNASAQHSVHVNPDLALHVSREHHHQHVHHDAFAEKDRHDEIAYTTGTTFEPSAIPDQDLRNHSVSKNEQHLKSESGKGGETKVIDAEKGRTPSLTDLESDEPAEKGMFSRYYAKFRISVHLFVLLLFTGWWIASLILHRDDKNWIIPFLLWLAISVRMITFHVPISYVSDPIAWSWRNTGTRVYDVIPEKMRVPLGALITLAVILLG